ncbi:hypothetical protein BH09PSE2_BH09PSE2_13710 [soil metagenome]
MLIPTFAVRDIREAAAFYTDVLDFTLTGVMEGEPPFYAMLTRGRDELHLSLAHERRPAGQTAVVICDDVDGLFAFFRRRGLPPSQRADSPVHTSPAGSDLGHARGVYRRSERQHALLSAAMTP